VTEVLGLMNSWLAESWPLAVAASFLWGLCSVLLSPCHLVSVPLVVGIMNGREDVSRKGALLLSLLFALGMLVTVAVIGIVTARMGRLLGDTGRAGAWIIGVLLILFGASLAGFVPMPSFLLEAAGRFKGKGALSALLMGLLLGVGLGPCTFAFLAPVLGLVFAAAPGKGSMAMWLLTAFAAGHSLVIVLAGVCTVAVKRFLEWDLRSRGTVWVKRACGLLVAAGGVYLIVS
jgi:cytochrome c-type biogenesis protein